MNCTEIEKDIYLYDELPTSERAIVDAHITQCDSCKELLAVLQIHQSVIQKVAQQKPQPENFSRLTSSIMRAIDEKETPRIFSKLLDRIFLRYAFAAVSLSLMVVFFAEQLSLSNASSQLYKRMPQSKTVTLKTSGTLVNVIKKKEEGRSETSLYACVKSGDCGNPLSKTLN
jgi:hypothetical protein